MTFLNTEVFYFTYDPQGHPATVKWNNHVYYYITNLQGDVIAILDQGTVVVEYKYDAWGKLLSITGSEAQMIGRLNPLRYRGYVYDQETGLYYLQSRYYNPEWGRFLNADALVSTGGLLGNNMFAYCGNNPINTADHSGNKPGDVFDTVDEAARDAAISLYDSGTFDKTYEYGATIYSVMVWETQLKLVPKLDNSLLGKLMQLLGCKNEMHLVPVRVQVKKYKYTRPVTFRRKDFVLPPFKNNAVAMIHSHPYVAEYGYDKFSSMDKLYAGLMGMPYYLYTATGRLLKYDPAAGVKEICKDLPKDPNLP